MRWRHSSREAAGDVVTHVPGDAGVPLSVLTSASLADGVRV